MADKDKAQKQPEQSEQPGLFGTEADTTPNVNYTASGSAKGLPVPETAADPVLARREAHSDNA